MYLQIIRRERNINDKDNFGKSYKFKANLLLLTKLIILFNLDELSNQVLYIGIEGVLYNTSFGLKYKKKKKHDTLTKKVS